ncbi:hypothetical protein [Streptomyces sp. AC550_RSS872]|uniref:hypothetical protein n=1 Tax=Streptomyces sp. AC550_RSS872 TaxID=2823689 RepID=UPI0035ABF59C
MHIHTTAGTGVACLRGCLGITVDPEEKPRLVAGLSAPVDVAARRLDPDRRPVVRACAQAR